MTYLHGIYAQTPLNTTEISQEELNIANKFRSNPLRWNGQFSPQLVEVLLNKYAAQEAAVLDPFVGSGTTLLEAGITGRSAIGLEINPAARMLSQTYETINVPLESRKEDVNTINDILAAKLPSRHSLFNGNTDELPDYKIKEILLDCFHSQARTRIGNIIETLIVLLDFYKPGLTVDGVYKEWAKLSQLLSSLPFSANEIRVLHADARRTSLPEASVDFVITSPPYINVFNYHQQYRASVESLYDGILRMAHSEIGANRKHRGNRFLTVIQYCLDMALAFMELQRLCRKNAKVIFVVGKESMVRGTPFYNGELVAEVAHRAANMTLVLRQQRVFQNKFGESIYEDILHFTAGNEICENNAGLEAARKIAKEVLQTAYQKAPDKARSDIEDAITNVELIDPSPYFDQKCIVMKHGKEAITA